MPSQLKIVLFIISIIVIFRVKVYIFNQYAKVLRNVALTVGHHNYRLKAKKYANATEIRCLANKDD